MPISILTSEGLTKILQKLKAVFATKTELTTASESLSDQFNQLESNAVHKTGDEFISGTKSFLVNSPSESDISINGLQMVASDSSVTRYGTPSKNKYLSTCYWSSEALANPITSSNYRNYLLGCMEYASRSDGQRDLKLFCCKPDNSGYITNKLMIGFDKDGVSFAQAPSTSTTRTAGDDIVTRNFIPNDTRIVHTTGNETIAGTKTFSSTISGTVDKALKDGDGSTISSTYLKLSGGTMTGNITMTGNSKSFVVTNNTYTTSLQVGSGGVNRGLWDATLNKWIVYANASDCFLNGNASTASKLETARTINGVSFDGSANITIADSTKLPLTGGTITGSFTNKVENYERGVTTTKIDRQLIDVRDKNGTRFSLLECNIAADKSTKTALFAYNTTATSGGNIGYISIGCDSSGAVVTSAPTPAVADNSTKIATTAWARTATGNFACNAATATKLATARTINVQDSSATNTGTGASFDGSGNATIKLPATIKATITGNCSGSSGSCTGNSATASKLETARTINGVSFDGSANITIADSTKLPLAGGALTGALRCTAKYTNATTTYTSDILTFNSGNVTYGNNVALGGGGNTIIGGGESYSAQLNAVAGNSSEDCYVCADGTIYLKTNCQTFANAKITTIGTDGKVSCPQGFIGTIAASSDARLKKDVEKISSRMLDAWEGIDWVQFKFKTDDSKTHFGIIAQDLNKRLSDSGMEASSCTIAESTANHDPATMDELPEALTVNYIEALVIEAAYLRRRCKMLEDRMLALEIKIN